MISYVFLGIALLAGAVKGFCGKKTSGYISTYKDALLVNTIRMLWCILIGFLFVLFQGGLSTLALGRQSIGIIVLSGVSSAAFVVSWLVCVKRGAYMMMDVFLMLGTAIPLLGGMLFLQEEIRQRQWIGLAVLVVACIIMCSYNNSIKEKLTPLSFALLLFCGIACGFSDFSQKLFVTKIDGGSVAAFNLYSYMIATVVLAGCYVVCRLGEREKTPSEQGRRKPMFWYICIMALCLFINSFFQTKAAVGISSAQLYPLSKSAALVLSSLMAALFFKEKLTPKCIVGMIIAFCGLLIINL